MTVEQNKALMSRFVEEFINARKSELADELFAPGAVILGESGLPTGPDGIKQKIENVIAAFPDFNATTDFIVADGNRVTAHLSESGTHQGEYFRLTPTGKRIAWTEIVELEISDDKIVASWFQTQMLDAIQQIAPSPAELIDLYYKYANAGATFSRTIWSWTSNWLDISRACLPSDR
jgi:predicted ester cyclase